MSAYYCRLRLRWFDVPSTTPAYQPPGWHPPAEQPQPIDTSKTHYRFTPTFQAIERERMSDEDIDRIAKRVVEMLKEKP
jgi:hypothetical protein